MNLDQMIGTLKSERDAIDAAILVLERLAITQQRRRGRPPAWLQVRREQHLEPAGRETRRTRKMSEETKKKMAEAQRKRWAAYRKEKHD